MRVRYLGWEDPLEEEMATHSSILSWRIPWTEEPWGCKELDMTEQASAHHLLTVLTPGNHFTSLNLNFPICKME